MWHMAHRGWWTLSQNFRSLALMVWKWRYFEHYKQKDHQLSKKLINDEGFSRTALAIPILLMKKNIVFATVYNIIFG